MLKSVVLPAPLGPITPTISCSWIFTLTSRLAWTPPKRLAMPRASSTDIGDLHLLRPLRVRVELPARQPALERPDLLADAAGRRYQRQQQQDRSQHQRRQLGGQVVGRGDGGQCVLEEAELAEQV